MSNGNGNNWGVPNRPKVSLGVSFPDQKDGVDGDVQIKQTNLGAKLFGKIGGSWYGAPLTATEGNPITRIGVNMSDHLSIDRDSVDIYKDSVKVAEFGQDTTITGGTITIQGTTGTIGHEKLVIEDNSISIYANNTEVFDVTGDTVTVGSHGTTKIVLDGGDGTLEVGSKFDIDSSGNVTVEDINIDGTINNIGSSRNQMFGYSQNDGGTGNVGIGFSACGSGRGGALYNVAVGHSSLAGLTSGHRNICIGQTAGLNLENGSNNVIIGDSNAADVDTNDTLIICCGDGDVTWLTGASSGEVSLDVNDTSDRNRKQNIVSIGEGLNIVKQLRPVTFEWKKDSRKSQGFIAQEIEEVLPDCVSGTEYEEDEDGIANGLGKAINVTGIVASIAKAVQELSAKLDTMQTEINNLKAE